MEKREDLILASVYVLVAKQGILLPFPEWPLLANCCLMVPHQDQLCSKKKLVILPACPCLPCRLEWGEWERG